MIHPKTELRFVNSKIGYGVFATEFIPKGTILYVKDRLEIEITKNRFNKMDQTHKDIVEKFSYMDERGVRIVSWDHAKYINHKCDCNSMSSGYGFEIAIRDIARDEEITDEYGLFNIPDAIEISCGCHNCRQMLLPTDVDQHHMAWDLLVREAIEKLNEVEQPLWNMMDSGTRTDVMGFLSGRSEYKSVIHLKYQGQLNKKHSTIKSKGLSACAA
ncbi:MAG: SET domain-containing protein [Gammaproteobacteria bacterium]|nr:SET domain-containing protein [Gammaproteobacteria bacterium]